MAESHCTDGTTRGRRILYFDIDGVLLDYNDEPKSALSEGRLEALVKRCNFDELVCVSGWSDIVQNPALGVPRELQGHKLQSIIAGPFPDTQWFLQHLTLASDTDHRGLAIDLTADWYYVDDWADKFFTDAHGDECYQRHLGTRILLTDAHGDGSDVLT